jgi:hypothetical protein
MMGNAAARSAFRVGAAAWSLSLPITALLLWAVVEQLGYRTSWLVHLAGAGIAMGAVSVVLAVLSKESQRVLLFVAAAALALAPLVFPFCVMGLAYFFLPLHSSAVAWSMRAAVLVGAVWWCVRELRHYQQRIIDKRFIEREFSFEPDRIVVRRPQKTDLSPPPVSDKTFFGRLYHRFGGYLIMLVPLAYPLQRLFADAGGIEAVLLLLAVLCTPLVIYILGRITCGAYLWIYKVRQLEREHGKPVVFADAGIAT